MRMGHGFPELLSSHNTAGARGAGHSHPEGFLSTLRGFRSLLRIGLLSCLLGAWCVGSATAQCYSITPSSLSLSYGKVTVGTVSSGRNINITNTCGTPLTINSFSLGPLEFQLVDGRAPATIPVGRWITFVLAFAPDAGETFTGQISIVIQGVNSPVVVSLSGTGVNTNAKASVTPSTLTFANQPLGSTSAAQTVTITNVGTSKMTVNGVSVDAPFTVSGYSSTVLLNPGNSLALPVTFFGQATGTFTSTLVFSIDVLPAVGVSVTGNGVLPASLAITNFPTLPSATQGYAYLAQLLSAGGQGSVIWSLISGSSLPAGLALSSAGAINGSVGSTVGVGSYPFTVQASDSAGNMATAQITLPVGAPTGAMCNNITWYVAGGSNPIIPINDLGTGTYLGAEGGLYPNGSNVRPAGHDADGVALAQSIQPLDGNGNPDPNGKYVLLSIGMSNAHTDFAAFSHNANADPTKGPLLVIVNGAQNEASASCWADPNDSFWNAISDYLLPQAGVTANQVVAAWVEDSESSFTGTFPGDINALTNDLIALVQNLHSKFPNLQLAYFTSFFYAGYGAKTKRPEPYGYETGFAFRNVIEDQLDGDPNLNYNPNNGPVMAPWLSWGPYEWANGLLARSDGLTYSCQEFSSDGGHPSNTVGREKDANQILNFFKTDDTTTPWFLAH